MKRSCGFTLVEMLVALTVFSLLLTGMLYSERHLRRATADEAAALQGSLEHAAVELLRAEVGLAGYRNEGADIHVATGPGGDRVSVRYLEDRIGDAASIRTVTFDAGTDGAGRANLYRKEGSGTRQPAVLGLVQLRVKGWIDRDTGSRTSMLPTRPGAIVLELAFAWEERTEVVVGFPNEVTSSEEPWS